MYYQSKRLQDNQDPEPQVIRKVLGSWTYPSMGARSLMSGTNGITIKAFRKRVTKKKEAFEVFYRRVQRCINTHKSKFRKIVIESRHYEVVAIGTRLETAEEVRKRLARLERQDQEHKRYKRRVQKDEMVRLIKENPDVVRQALKKHDREQAAKLVTADPAVVRKALNKKSKR